MFRSNIKYKLNIKKTMTDINFDKFIVYTDGACKNNGKATALSSIGIYFSNHNLHKIDSVSRVLNVPKHTNNVAELTAINESLLLIKKNNINIPIHIYTDSQYSINVITKWYPKWTDKDKKTKLNVPLIDNIYELYTDIKPHFHYIKAHTNLNDEHSLGNAIADQLATDALEKFDKENIGILKYFQ
jgi:ribonuclease HI